MNFKGAILSLILLNTTSAFSMNNSTEIDSFPHEIMANIFSYLKPNDLNSLENTNKKLNSNIKSLNSYLLNKKKTILSGNKDTILAWIDYYKKQEIKPTSEEVVINYNSDSAYDYNYFHYNSAKLSYIISEIRETFPNLKKFTLNEKTLNLSDQMDFNISNDTITFTGSANNIRNLFGLINTNSEIKNIVLNFKKDVYHTNPYSGYIVDAIAYQLPAIKTIAINDLDGVYFTCSYFFDSDELYKIYIKKQEKLHIIRNGIEQVYTYKDFAF